MTELNLHVDPAAAEIPVVADCIRSFCRHQAIDEQTAFEVVICVMEAMNNVLEHALVGAQNERIVVACAVRGERLVIEIIDRGRAMRTPPPISAPDTGTIDGRGWYILRSWMDAVSYRRHGAVNSLQLIKTLSPTRAA